MCYFNKNIRKRKKNKGSSSGNLPSITQMTNSRASSFYPCVQMCKPCWPGPAEAPLTLKAFT